MKVSVRDLYFSRKELKHKKADSVIEEFFVRSSFIVLSYDIFLEKMKSYYEKFVQVSLLQGEKPSLIDFVKGQVSDFFTNEFKINKIEFDVIETSIKAIELKPDDIFSEIKKIIKEQWNKDRYASVLALIENYKNYFPKKLRDLLYAKRFDINELKNDLEKTWLFDKKKELFISKITFEFLFFLNIMVNKFDDIIDYVYLKFKNLGTNTEDLDKIYKDIAGKESDIAKKVISQYKSGESEKFEKIFKDRLEEISDEGVLRVIDKQVVRKITSVSDEAKKRGKKKVTSILDISFGESRRSGKGGGLADLFETILGKGTFGAISGVISKVVGKSVELGKNLIKNLVGSIFGKSEGNKIKSITDAQKTINEAIQKVEQSNNTQIKATVENLVNQGLNYSKMVEQNNVNIIKSQDERNKKLEEINNNVKTSLTSVSQQLQSINASIQSGLSEVAKAIEGVSVNANVNAGVAGGYKRPVPKVGATGQPPKPGTPIKTTKPTGRGASSSRRSSRPIGKPGSPVGAKAPVSKPGVQVRPTPPKTGKGGGAKAGAAPKGQHKVQPQPAPKPSQPTQTTPKPAAVPSAGQGAPGQQTTTPPPKQPNQVKSTSGGVAQPPVATSTQPAPQGQPTNQATAKTTQPQQQQTVKQTAGTQGTSAQTGQGQQGANLPQQQPVDAQMPQASQDALQSAQLPQSKSPVTLGDLQQQSPLPDVTTQLPQEQDKGKDKKGKFGQWLQNGWKRLGQLKENVAEVGKDIASTVAQYAPAIISGAFTLAKTAFTLYTLYKAAKPDVAMGAGATAKTSVLSPDEMKELNKKLFQNYNIFEAAHQREAAVRIAKISGEGGRANLGLLAQGVQGNLARTQAIVGDTSITNITAGNQAMSQLEQEFLAIKAKESDTRLIAKAKENIETIKKENEELAKMVESLRQEISNFRDINGEISSEVIKSHFGAMQDNIGVNSYIHSRDDKASDDLRKSYNYGN
ncbi:MAG: hypothetical protein QXF12_01025 [Candidatus Aenigmatarchaeota archaeon]